jgi:hypothetical protein
MSPSPIFSTPQVMDERFATRFPEVTPGEYAQLSVTDNGVGMSDELQRRVFERALRKVMRARTAAS